MKESKFDKLAKEIAEEYEDKGKSPQEAMEIGEATAAKIGRAKFGKRKFAKMGQKAEFEAFPHPQPLPSRTKGSKRNTSLKGADLTGYDLTGVNLTGADLTDANLYSADLSNANLGNADLYDADLRNAHLMFADLSGANLIGAYLTSANLDSAHLRYADLSEADLRDADLSNAYLTEADLDARRLADADLMERSAKYVRKADTKGSKRNNSRDSVQAVLDGYRTLNKGSFMILTPILIGVGLLEIYKRVSDKPESSEVSAAEVADNSETSEPFDRMPGATQIVDNMVQRRKANNILFEKNAPTLWPSGGLTVVNMIDAIQRGDNLPEFPTTKI